MITLLHLGRLHFVKFETSHVEDAIAFIESKGLHRFQGKGGQKEMRVITTGEGGRQGRAVSPSILITV